MSPVAYRQAIDKDGFSIIEGVLEQYEVAALREAMELFIQNNNVKKYGIRRILELVPAVDRLCWQPAIRNIVEPILGSDAFPVRGIFFDKNPETN